MNNTDSSFSAPHHHVAKGNLWKMSLAALGVVYGDIGTSPLYAFKECFAPHFGLSATPENVIGICSLIFWSLMVVVTIKYLIIIMRADNNGEGGILALLSLLMKRPDPTKPAPKTPFIIMLGVFGAAMLYGDGVITPAISVISAVEGLQVASPVFAHVVLPLTVVILVALFMIQKRGTEKIGMVFGPLVLIWFASIALVSIPWIVLHPEVLQALNPFYGLNFIFHHGHVSFLVLGAVVLCVTGGEAMYADMGHFGIRPIRIAWYWIVFPALILNYLGQGALILEKGEAGLSNPFYLMVPTVVLYPMIIVATTAAVIASQALISGVYSLTAQASQLGFLPRVEVLHTSEQTEGQIYLPFINYTLMFACIILVLLFKESSSLAAAYGISVTGTMAITSILFYYVARIKWHWNKWQALLVVGGFLIIDLTFFTSNLLKFFEGGWVPIMLALATFVLMQTWSQGRMFMSHALFKRSRNLKDFSQEVLGRNIHRVPGTAVVMTANPNVAPPVLLHHLEHNKVLHERLLLLTVIFEHQPYVDDDKLKLINCDANIVQVKARYGYAERPTVKDVFALCAEKGLVVDANKVSYYFGRETILPTGLTNMHIWRKKLFAFLARNSYAATSTFGIPSDGVIEVGMQLEL